MAGIKFEVELDDAALRARLADLVERLDRPIAFYKEVGEYLRDEAIRDNFLNERAPDGTPWAQLSPVTVHKREKAGTTPVTILRETKRLSASIVSQPSETGVEIGSAIPYAAVMQFGAEQGKFGAWMGQDKRGRPHFHHLPWGNIPARPYLGLSAEDEIQIIRIAGDWLDRESATA